LKAKELVSLILYLLAGVFGLISISALFGIDLSAEFSEVSSSILDVVKNVLIGVLFFALAKHLND
jgi:hypothetical protein